jgi:hypothetical protein
MGLSLIAGIFGATACVVLASPAPIRINLSSRLNHNGFVDRASGSLPKRNVHLKNYHDGTDLQ